MISRRRNTTKDIEKIQEFSNLVEKNLSKFSKKNEKKIESLSFEELQDLNNVLQMADYVMTKYENKKEVYSLLKDFVDMITNSSSSIDLINDKINELVISAEGTLSKIKNLQNDVSESYSVNAIATISQNPHSAVQK